MASTVLVPIDTLEESSWREVLPVAVDHARQHDSTLHLATVLEQMQMNLAGLPSADVINQARRDEAARQLAEVAAAMVPADVAHEQHVEIGRVHTEILRLAETLGADLIIMASHRPALRTYLMGAHAAHVVRHARCSVFVVRPDGY